MKGHLMLEEKITQSDSVAPASTAVPMPQPHGYPWAWLMVLTAAAGSGLLLTMCHFPLSWGGLSWLALVPLLVLVRTRAHFPHPGAPAVRPDGWPSQKPVRTPGVAARGWFSTALWVYFCAWVSGSIFYWIVLAWMPASNEMMTYAWYGLSVYCAFYFPVAIFLTRVLDRWSRLPLFLTFPVVWVGLDFVRSFFATGFPWYFLGHTQHIFLPVIQIADLGGAYLVTFLVVMVNAQVFEWVYLSLRARNFFGIPEPPPEVEYRLFPSCFLRSLIVGAALIAALLYGAGV